ncbi:MAG: hypothetical protein UR53_C0002G0014 [Candidatus Magasanikbacteria bacterium GW2011_GWC2_34_16]|uniref:Gluconeogenesis factor n=2 Tax=Candidatus Magasanikiibacteriota TaxID=1752731 RepID=A0A0G0HPG2_9BACT|nr:MAG: hypothetical protein UR53_C0002G0014 [Candidatus Magasanikbacteria bacterium GW2011_GWC2_34_16]KKQ40495.1 MAG: hypothetical protein US58_C0019G0008 [Candidatus Magasanikbacteria bacterium GW2011_GWA2_37_8]
MKKKVVVIGGGNGSAISIVALKQNLDLFDISAVIAMSDSGGSSGRLRQKYNILPPGDVLRAALAMSSFDYPVLKKIFYGNRFFGLDELDGHNLGNLFVLSAWQISGDFIKSLRALEQGVEAVGKVYPNFLDPSHICVELFNGDIVKTDELIDKPKYDRSLKIKKIYLDPEVTVYEEAIKVILEADYIIFGPGSLYTSVIATILPKGVKKAIDNNKKAKLIYVVGNAYHTNGETGPDDVAGCVRALENYLPRSLDLVIYSGNKLTEQQKQKYDTKGWSLLIDNGDLLGDQLLRAPYEKDNGGVCSIKLGKILKEVCK